MHMRPPSPIIRNCLLICIYWCLLLQMVKSGYQMSGTPDCWSRLEEVDPSGGAIMLWIFFVANARIKLPNFCEQINTFYVQISYMLNILVYQFLGRLTHSSSLLQNVFVRRRESPVKPQLRSSHLSPIVMYDFRFIESRLF